MGSTVIDMGCFASKSTIITHDEDCTQIGSDDIHEREESNCQNTSSDLLAKSKKDICKKVSRNLLPNATMNINQPQTSFLDDEHISKMADEFLQTAMGYNKKYKQMEIGSKPFELKEVKLAEFAIYSCAKSIVSDDGMDCSNSEWVQPDDIDKQKLKVLRNIS